MLAFVQVDEIINKVYEYYTIWLLDTNVEEQLNFNKLTVTHKISFLFCSN